MQNKRFTLDLRLPEVKSALRVKTLGEVYTPTRYVGEMLDMLEDQAWSNPSWVFVEPTCGCGAFVLEVLIRKFKAILGSRTAQSDQFEAMALALNSIVGLDIQKDNIADTKANMLRQVILRLGISDRPTTKEIRFIATATAIIDCNFTENDSLKAKIGKFIHGRFGDQDSKEQTSAVDHIYKQIHWVLKNGPNQTQMNLGIKPEFAPDFLKDVINL